MFTWTLHLNELLASKTSAIAWQAAAAKAPDIVVCSMRHRCSRCDVISDGSVRQTCFMRLSCHGTPVASGLSHAGALCTQRAARSAAQGKTTQGMYQGRSSRGGGNILSSTEQPPKSWPSNSASTSSKIAITERPSKKEWW
mmetsp:Transcript_60301/g.145671  ORF Transcript_60301/g.145671 Transcript_60301/m.145671 type:complete len:141 (+) Transcript_60301:970-1392(+)